MRTQRGIVDYSLRRRAVLTGMRSGRAPVHEVCDAPPTLVRAARLHGVGTELACPVCRKENLTHVYQVSGEELTDQTGSARTPEQLDRMALRYGQFHVDLVEVCRSCGWHHLVSAFELGYLGAGIG